MYRLVLTELLKSSSWTVSLKVKDLRSAVVARLISKQVSSIQQDFCSQKQIRHQKSRKLQKSSADDSYLKVTSLRIRGHKTWVYIWTFSWSVYCSLKPEMVSVEGKLGGQVRQTTEEWTENECQQVWRCERGVQMRHFLLKSSSVCTVRREVQL